MDKDFLKAWVNGTNLEYRESSSFSWKDVPSFDKCEDVNTYISFSLEFRLKRTSSRNFGVAWCYDYIAKEAYIVEAMAPSHANQIECGPDFIKWIK